MSIRRTSSGKNKNLVKTFTFYIPAPPHRKTGYREREFDKIMQGILTSGFDLVNLQCQPVGGSENSGLFIVAIIKAKDKKVWNLDMELDIHERFKLAERHSSPDIILDEEEDA
ncbi:MAG: hypothetical protein V4598_19825 [Bdellovibrionota bacterium]